MRVSIDQKTSEMCPLQAQIKVGEFVESLVSELPKNRIVTRVIVNGKKFDRSEDPFLVDRHIEEISDLEIQTVDKDIWANNGLEEAISCVDRVQRTMLRAAELFRETNYKEAHPFFLHCLEGLEKFLETLMITRAALGLDFQKIFYEGVSLTQHEHNLLLILKNILYLQEQNNFESLSDKLEYELLTNLVGWGQALRNLLNQNSNS